jgi:DNA repair protein RadC
MYLKKSWKTKDTKETKSKENTRVNVELTEEQKIRVANSGMVYKIMREILMREDHIERGHQHCWTCCLSPANKILNIELISLGAIDEAIIKPMQVYRIAVHKGAVKIIMIHNNSGGILSPTEMDMEVTDRMYQVGKILGIEFIDHMVINESGYYSFLESGLLSEISKSLKWVPLYEEQEKLRKEKKSIEEKARKEGFDKGLKKGISQGKKEGIEVGIEKGIRKGISQGKKEGIKEGKKEGKKEQAIKIAKALKKQIDSNSKIARITGLTVEEVEKL